MQVKLTPETVEAAARIVDLPLTKVEVDSVLERLQSLLDSTDQIAHLFDDTADVDARFDARWGIELA